MAEIEIKQTNISITPNDFEYSGGAVTAIKGKILGGTGGTIIGNTYYGDEQTITIKQNNIISITDSYTSAYYTKNQTNENFVPKNSYEPKITEIDSGLAYLSANKQDDLIFGYYNNSISAINGSAINVNGNFYSASNPSGFVNSEQVGTQIDEKLQNYYLKTDTSGKDELSAEFAKYTKTEDLHIPTTVAELTDSSDYYTKTETSGKNQLSAAFDAILKYNVTAAAGIQVTTATDDGVKTFGISMTAEPVVTDTTLSGYNGIAAALDGNVSGRWNVGLTQDMLNTINDKIDSVYTGIGLSGDGTTDSPLGIETDASLYLINASAKSAISAEYANVATNYMPTDGGTSISIATTIDSLSEDIGDIETVLNDKYTLSAGSGIYFYEDVLNKITRIDCTVTAATTVAQLTDSANYYKKDETSGANEINAALTNKANASALNNYLTTAQYATDSATFVTSGDYISGSKQYALTSGGWAEITANTDYTAGTDLKIDENNVISVDTNGNANNTATNNHNFVAGSWTVASGYNCFAEGIATSALGYGVHAQGMWTCFSSTDGQTTGGGSEPIYWGNGAGAIVEGYCNATTACPMSGTGNDYGPIHGGIIKVIGNGYVENEDHETSVHVHYPSDALILYRDGSLSAAGKISAAGIELGAEPDLSDYIPYSATQLPIGTNNDVSNYSMGIGYANTANYGDVTANHIQYGSLAFGYENFAGKMSFAAGNGNTAYHVGFAVGYHCSANEHAVAMNNECTAYDYAFAAGNNCKAGNYSFAEGNGTSAYNRSFAAGEGSTATDHSFVFGLTQCYANRESFVAGNASTADDFSFACGPANKAYKHSYVIGRGLEFSGAYTGGYHLGAFVVGGWNATKSWSGPTASSPLFIVGNGTGNGANRSDAMIVYRDGTVKAKDFVAGGDTLSANYPVPKSIPNTGDSTLKVQRMFVCTSDNDIIAHAGLAEGEGCIFFRVGS